MLSILLWVREQATDIPIISFPNLAPKMNSN